MTIEVKDGRFFSRWYFAGAPDADFDVLAAVWRDPGKHWEAAYRFRYHSSDGTPDEKRWYEIKFPEDKSEQDVLNSFGGVLSAAASGAGLTFTTVVVQSDDPKEVMRTLLAQPWAHLTEIRPADKDP